MRSVAAISAQPPSSTAFSNSSATQNDLLTSLNTRNEKQVSEYISYRLNEWDDFNPNIGKDISKLDIADAALWLTDVNKTETEIQEEFIDKEDLFHMAVYVIDNRLDRCFNSGINSVKCFINWRDDYSEDFNEIADEIKTNAVLITANNALIKELNNEQLKFTINEDGLITGITLIDGTLDEEENFLFKEGDKNFVYIDKIDSETNTYDKKILTYSSVGKEIGLTYSDFGSYTVKTEVYDLDKQDVLTSDLEKSSLFAGGYEAYKMSEDKIKDSISSDIDFSGIAVGRVTNSEGKEFTTFDNNAKLSFSKYTGESNFFVNFNNWYTVSVSKDMNATEADISFYNYMGLSDFKLPDDVTSGKANMEVGYYGANPETGIPTEATGLIQFSDPSGINLGVTFGVN